MRRTELIEEAIVKKMGVLTDTGALVVDTGKHTGRAAQCRYIVQHPELAETIDWGNVNRPISPGMAQRLKGYVLGRFETQKVYTFQGYVAGFPVEVRSLSPWHTAFASNMFRPEAIHSLKGLSDKKVQVFHDPYGKASEIGEGFDSDTYIVLDPVAMTSVIVGTAYAGEIKKSAFALCNYALPQMGVLPMHASANCLEDGSNSCVLFGLSGTGKTTLSAAMDRSLIGDDEIVWTPQGLSNMEGGCYAKLIDLDAEKEPQIYRATNQFGAILENVSFKKGTRQIDYADRSKTENTRGSYPLEAIDNVFDQGRDSSPPKSIVFLEADAFGAMPAVAKLNSYQARFYFISGYTAKVAGTEMGVKEPSATFSACFGAPFMPRHPAVYGDLLAKLAEQHGCEVWLLNTGWTHGDFKTGERFPIPVTRKILSAIQSGELGKQPTVKHPVFGFEVPTSCPGVESKWLEIPNGDAPANLARTFHDNIRKHADAMDPEVIEKGGPTVHA
ncbi:MAG: phosphoenolpyruvate carboxykinase (ATP) [Bdellovibrionaceae bacterium]|nr:phosphoenolpyruvate carboxykinase (ATP) [Bdellovibrionales bacterium]MCB9254411.1 phosphoenolpyruvate carboxykinase (ATP) [Pseudobdellovibrionaceae bacterium]